MIVKLYLSVKKIVCQNIYCLLLFKDEIQIVLFHNFMN